MTTVLIVDDNEQNLYQLQVLLGAQGYTVVCAANGADALAEARRDPPDLIVSDILMPVMDGFTLCREWKLDERLKSIPFVFYTATYTDDRDRDFAIGLGADGFLVKPEEPETIVRTICDLIGKTASSPAAPAEPTAESTGALATPAPAGEEAVFLKLYNQTLIRKLEHKVQKLEDAIAERKRVESALQEHGQRLASIYDTVGDIIFQLALEEDGGYRFASVNAAFLARTGMTLDQVVGKRVDEVIPQPSLSAALEKYETAVRERRIVRWEETSEYPAGKRIGEVSITPVFDEAGRCTHLVGGVHDITERIELEAQLRQAQKMEAVGSLAGGVAHDFNNLLQALLSQTQLLQTYARDPERVNAMGLELGQQISHGASLTRQLLLFSRRETTRPEALDLNDAVRGATKMLRRLLRANIALEIDLAPAALPVTADRGQFEQVLMNLTVNASDAMPEGGRLLVRTGRLDGEHVWLSVADTGSGIPDAIRERIFEPFFTTKVAGTGTGLGLSVVHGIVTRHGGRIEVESAAGRGASFRVILPTSGPGALPVAKEVEKAAVELPVGQGERILVVEDEGATRAGLRDILRNLGYEVVAVASGEEAGKLPAERPFDVLLTDLMLSGVSGSRLAAGLQERWPSMRVILMSGYPEDEAVRSGVDQGRVRFLQKPFDIARLAREIREALVE